MNQNKQPLEKMNLAKFKRHSLWPLLWPKMALALMAVAHLFYQYNNFFQAKKRLVSHEHYVFIREVELHLMQEQGTTFRYLYGLASLTEIKDHRMRTDIAIRKMRNEANSLNQFKTSERDLFSWIDQLEKWRGEVFAQNVQPHDGRAHYQELMNRFQNIFMMPISKIMPNREVYRVDMAAKSLSAFYLLRDELAHAVARNMPLSGPTLGQLMRKKAEIDQYAWWMKNSNAEVIEFSAEESSSSWTALNNHLVTLWQKGDQGNFDLLPKRIMDDTYDLEKELVQMFTHEMRGIQVVVKSKERFERTFFLASLGAYLIFFSFLGSLLFGKWRSLTFAYALAHRLSRHHRNTKKLEKTSDRQQSIIADEDMFITLGAMRPFVFGVKQTLLKIKGTWAQMELSGATEGEVVLEELRPLWQKAYEESSKAMEILQESIEMTNTATNENNENEAESENVASLSTARIRRREQLDIKKIAS